MDRFVKGLLRHFEELDATDPEYAANIVYIEILAYFSEYKTRPIFCIAFTVSYNQGLRIILLADAHYSTFKHKTLVLLTR